MTSHRQLEFDDRAQEFVRNLSHDSRTIACTGIGADSPAMFKIAQRAQGNVDDVVTRGPTQGRHHGEATRIFFFGRVIKPDRCGHETKPLMRQWKRHGTLRKARTSEGRQWPKRENKDVPLK